MVRLSYAVLTLSLLVLTASRARAEDRAPSRQPIDSQCSGVVLELQNVKIDQYGNASAEVVLHNTSDRTYELIATMDGSSFGRRNPRLDFDLSTTEIKGVGLCGMMNEMTEGDFLTLRPGAKKRLEWVHIPTPAKRGRYELRATYTNDPRVPKRDPHHGEEKFQKRIAATVPCQVTSKTVELHVP